MQICLINFLFIIIHFAIALRVRNGITNLENSNGIVYMFILKNSQKY